ncbi:hypothetical protein [Paraflavitalea pollutisoli]|uniref:hypothetical protein n=1 Tax=Paraflavitalea pollutisoli TaxID=3034143 RepID=UPI0023EB99B9|nr:hypothetical protein [Paraflavitalea sp. H1-2-19X]
MSLSHQQGAVTIAGNRTWPFKRINYWLAAIVLGAVIGLVVLNAFFSLDKDSFGRDIGVALLQVVAVGVAGGVVSKLLEQYVTGRQRLLSELQQHQAQLLQKQEQEKAEQAGREQQQRWQVEQERDAQRIVVRNKNELKKDLIRRISHIYNEAKAARRMLRAKALSTAYNDRNVVNANLYIKPYAQYLEVLNDLQLELENIKEEVRFNKTSVTFYTKEAAIYAGLQAMEDYLGEVIAEYENSRTKFLDKAYAPYMDFDKLKDLLSTARVGSTTAFRTRFIEAYRQVIADLLEDLVNPAQP